jgi:hypothetical protein
MQERASEVIWIIAFGRPYIDDRPGIVQRLSDCDQYACTLTPFNMDAASISKIQLTTIYVRDKIARVSQEKNQKEFHHGWSSSSRPRR